MDVVVVVVVVESYLNEIAALMRNSGAEENGTDAKSSVSVEIGRDFVGDQM